MVMTQTALQNRTTPDCSCTHDLRGGPGHVKRNRNVREVLQSKRDTVIPEATAVQELSLCLQGEQHGERLYMQNEGLFTVHVIAHDTIAISQIFPGVKRQTLLKLQTKPGADVSGFVVGDISTHPTQIAQF